MSRTSEEPSPKQHSRWGEMPVSECCECPLLHFQQINHQSPAQWVNLTSAGPALRFTLLLYPAHLLALISPYSLPVRHQPLI